jgi:hypothetical protein
VNGTASPGATVFITFRFGGFGGFTQQVTADEAGAFTQQLGGGGGGGGPLPAGLTIDVAIADEAGMRTTVVRTVPQLEVLLGSREIQGEVSPMTQVELSLLADDTVEGQATTTSDPFGALTATLAAGEVVPGKLMRLVDPHTGTTEFTLPALTAVIDRGAAVLQGTAAPGTQVQVSFEMPGGEVISLQTQANMQGNWSVDDGDLPPGAGVSIAQAVSAQARVTVANGHGVRIVATTGVVPTPTGPTPTPTATRTPGPGTETPPPPGGPTIYLPWAAKDATMP